MQKNSLKPRITYPLYKSLGCLPFGSQNKLKGARKQTIIGVCLIEAIGNMYHRNKWLGKKWKQKSDVTTKYLRQR